MKELKNVLWAHSIFTIVNSLLRQLAWQTEMLNFSRYCCHIKFHFSSYCRYIIFSYKYVGRQSYLLKCKFWEKKYDNYFLSESCLLRGVYMLVRNFFKIFTYFLTEDCRNRTCVIVKITVFYLFCCGILFILLNFDLENLFSNLRNQKSWILREEPSLIAKMQTNSIEKPLTNTIATPASTKISQKRISVLTASIEQTTLRFSTKTNASMTSSFYRLRKKTTMIATNSTAKTISTVGTQ